MKERSLSASCIGFVVAALLAVPSLSCAGKSQDHLVSVLYAGSLAGVMENGLGPAFTKATGYQYQGEAQGSLGAARLIHDRLRSPDVFISADPAVNETVLMGDGNQNLVTWYATLASSQLVLAYSPSSKFAAKFQSAAAGTIPWYEVLQTPGVKFGRGDPRIDPKGYRTLFLFDLAAKHYQLPKLRDLLGDPLNPDQVFPEVVLLARVETGQFDAGIFYKHEVVAHKLPFIILPAEISLGDPSFAGLYSQETYTTPSGEKVKGAPILFTITIPSTVQHKEAAEAFVRFMLTSNNLLEQFGLGSVEHRLTGSVSGVPADLRPLTLTEPAP
ncbi:MAG TPA: extracellular solute-binding protein [Blastocatellia bacterium]